MYISPFKLEFYRVEKGYKQYLLKKPMYVIGDGFDDICIPTNFKTDLTSIPRPLNKIIKRNNPKYARAALVHDFLYSRESENSSRLFADNMFWRCMKYEGVPKRYMIPFYISVRLFGFFRYKR